MSQPGEDSRLKKKTALENKWTASKARLRNIISSIDTSGTSPKDCILDQLTEARRYMTSVYDERSAMLAPTEQDEFFEDYNKQEKICYEAISRLHTVKNYPTHSSLPSFAKFDGKSFFTFFQSAIQFDIATGDFTKDKYLQQLTGYKTEVKWDKYFRDYKDNIASHAALEMLETRKMPVTLLLERFRRCIFLLSFTGHDRDWKFLLRSIIRKCMGGGREEIAEKELEKILRSLACSE